MNTSTRDITKKERRRRPDAPGTPVVVRIQPEMLAALDDTIARHPDPKPSRPEAMRRALGDWLASHDNPGRNIDFEGVE